MIESGFVKINLTKQNTQNALVREFRTFIVIEDEFNAVINAGRKNVTLVQNKRNKFQKSTDNLISYIYCSTSLTRL